MASAYTIVTCERLIEHDDMVRFPNRISIPFFAVDAVIEVPFGSYPCNCHGVHYFDEKHIPAFRSACENARKGDYTALKNYYDAYIFGVKNTAGFIDQLPFSQIQHVQKMEPGSRLEAVFTVLE